MAVEPDLVLAFSDLQADIVRELLRRGVTVFAFHQRSVEEILDMILVFSRIVGVPEKGAGLAGELRAGLESIAKAAKGFARRPRVWFEEWKDPLISGIRWVEELIEIAGGDPVFPELRNCAAAKDRIVDPAAVIARDPEIIIAWWCGMKVSRDFIGARRGWAGISAVRGGQV